MRLVDSCLAAGRAQLAAELEGYLAESPVLPFLLELLDAAPTTGSVRLFLHRRYPGAVYSTVLARFFRAGVPSPKAHLWRMRLALLSALFPTGWSLSRLSCEIAFPSQQSMNRSIRVGLGMSAAEYRSRFDLAAAVAAYRDVLVLPHQAAYCAMPAPLLERLVEV